MVRITRWPGYVARDLAQSPLAAQGNAIPKNQVVLSSEDRCSLARRFQDSCEEVMMRTRLYICFVTRFYPHERSLSLSLSSPHSIQVQSIRQPIHQLKRLVMWNFTITNTTITTTTTTPTTTATTISITELMTTHFLIKFLQRQTRSNTSDCVGNVST